MHSLRSYENLEWQYVSKQKSEAMNVIFKILGFRPLEAGLEYSLRAHNVAAKVDTRVAIRCKCGLAEWIVIKKKYRLKHIRDVENIPDWEDGFFIWLLDIFDHQIPLNAYIHDFINSRKHDFQDNVDDASMFFVATQSSVNSWCFVWKVNGYLNYLGVDQTF